MKHVILVSIFVLATGCGPTIDEVRSSPPAFEVTVPASWDLVGSCLARAYADDYQALYLPVPSERRAELTVTLVVTGPLSQAKQNLFALDIRGRDGPTSVTYRATARSNNLEQKARAEIDRCGKPG